MTTERFDNAVRKLYTAFHEGTLNAMDCKYCAVGNIVGSGKWASVFGCGNAGNQFSEDVFNYQVSVEKAFSLDSYEKGVKEVLATGYSPYELFNVEAIFMSNANSDEEDCKEDQFNGLCAVVEYLCELDNIPNVLEIQSLFKERNDVKLNQLV